MRKLFLVGMSGLFVSYLSAASIPAQITYQGTLKQSGVPANGPISMEFKIINADDSITYWNSQPITVTVTQGLFSQLLSPLNTLNPQNPLDWENTTPYIQVILNPGSAPITLAPAEPITTTMFSLVAGTVLDGSVSTQKLGDGAVTTVKLATASVTNAQLADMSVTSLAIANGAVGTPQLAALSVTSTTIADGAVTWQKIDPTTIPPSGLGFVPVGAIMMFDANCPADWTRYSTLDGNFPLASATAGQTGGSSTHQHLLPIFQSGPTGPGFGVARPQDTPWGGQSYPGTMIVNTFPSGGTIDNLIASLSGPASSMPPYMTMIFCKKD